MNTPDIISNGHKKRANVKYKLKVQILQMKYQNFQEDSGFTVGKSNDKFSIYHHVFISQKLLCFRFFKAIIKFTILHIKL